MNDSYIVRVLLDEESATRTYLLIDKATNKAALIDSVLEQVERDLNLIDEMGLVLEYAIETHVHADHITGASALKEKTKAKIVYGVASNVEGADTMLSDGDELSLGQTTIRVLTTPGHTNSCTCYYVEGALFTGDTLLIRSCGRTDFQEGSPETLFDNVRNKLFTFPDDTLVYPAHNYKGMFSSTIGEEKQYNARLKLENSKEDFVRIMDSMNPPLPKKFDIAVPANLKAGRI